MNPLLSGGISQPERLMLRAGPVSLEFEPETGFVRYVRIGSRELLRGVYAAVRDANWDTLEPRVHDLQAEVRPDSFEITFAVECRRDPIHFCWQGRLTGEPDGTVTYHFAGTALSTFRKNRIGFCVLHPAEACAGRPVRVEHAGGSFEETRFPAVISAEQPFFALCALREPLDPLGEHGLRGEVEVRLEGDTFEMEDQRNWTDGSFKSYCTPLSEPFPVEIAAGTRVEQAVRLRLLDGPIPVPAASREDRPRLLLSNAESVALPAVGLGMASHGAPLSKREREALRRLRPAHLRVDLRLSEPGWHEALAHAGAEAASLRAALEVAAFVSDGWEAELAALAARLESIPAPLSRCLIYPSAVRATGRDVLEAARRHVATRFPDLSVGGGSNANFAELNRGETPRDWSDCVCFALNPQVHAFDNASLVETLPMQGEAVRSARAVFPEARIVVSPVTLRPRFNAVATGPEPAPPPGELPWPVDPRQLSLFAAGWTLGSLKHLAESGAASVTYFETTGWRGVIEIEAGSPIPARFPSTPGALFPVYHGLAACLEWPGARLLPTRSTRPLALEGLHLLGPEGRRRTLVANLTGFPQEVEVEHPGPHATVRYLDEASAPAAGEGPLLRSDGAAGQLAAAGKLLVRLRPYSVACVDSRK